MTDRDNSGKRRPEIEEIVYLIPAAIGFYAAVKQKAVEPMDFGPLDSSSVSLGAPRSPFTVSLLSLSGKRLIET